MKELAIKVASWIWHQVGLDKEDESWRGMMFDDAVKEIEKIIRGRGGEEL